jgi:type IV secretory pathway VirB4 component
MRMLKVGEENFQLSVDREELTRIVEALENFAEVVRDYEEPEGAAFSEQFEDLAQDLNSFCRIERVELIRMPELEYPDKPDFSDNEAMKAMQELDNMSPEQLQEIIERMQKNLEKQRDENA